MTNEQSPMIEYEEVVEDLLSDLRAVAEILLGEEVKKEKVFTQEEEVSYKPGMSYRMHVDLSRNDDGAVVADWIITTKDGEKVTTEERQFVFPAKALGSARALLKGITPVVLSQKGEPEQVQQLHALFGNLMTLFEGQRGNEEAMEFVMVMNNRDNSRYERVSQLFQGM